MAGAYNRLADRTCGLMKENVLCLPNKLLLAQCICRTSSVWPPELMVNYD